MSSSMTSNFRAQGSSAGPEVFVCLSDPVSFEGLECTTLISAGNRGTKEAALCCGSQNTPSFLYGVFCGGHISPLPSPCRFSAFPPSVCVCGHSQSLKLPCCSPQTAISFFLLLRISALASGSSKDRSSWKEQCRPLAGFKFQPCCSVAMRPWGSRATSFCLSFLTCDMNI